MHTPNCSNWEYDHHPRCLTVLHQEVQQILVALRQGRIDAKQMAADTREIHRRLFQALTPPECAYYAGHYRGEDFS